MRKAKAITYLTIFLGLVVLVTAGFLAKDRVVEEWYLYRLEHGDQEAKRAAAEKLGAMVSVRAVPKLLRASGRATGIARGFAFSPDGRQLRTSLNNVRVRLSRDGKRIGNVSAGPTRIWDAATGNELIADFNVYVDALQKIIDRAGPAAVPFLITALNDSHSRVRCLAAYFLGGLGTDAGEAVPALVETLRKNMAPDDSVKYPVGVGVIWTLGEIGPEARAAIPVLKEALQKGRLREIASEALRKIQGENLLNGQQR